MPPAFMFYVEVSGLDAALACATRMGAKLMNGPMEVPGGARIAQLMDPQGVAFALHAITGPRSRPEESLFSSARDAVEPRVTSGPGPARPRPSRAPGAPDLRSLTRSRNARSRARLWSDLLTRAVPHPRD